MKIKDQLIELRNLEEEYKDLLTRRNEHISETFGKPIGDKESVKDYFKRKETYLKNKKKIVNKVTKQINEIRNEICSMRAAINKANSKYGIDKLVKALALINDEISATFGKNSRYIMFGGGSLENREFLGLDEQKKKLVSEKLYIQKKLAELNSQSL